jgi:hypothetical protein
LSWITVDCGTWTPYPAVSGLLYAVCSKLFNAVFLGKISVTLTSRESYKRKTSMNENTKEHLTSVKKSYFNILALFLGNDKIESRFLRCLLKWGIQLNFKTEDLKQANVDISDLKFLSIDDKVVKLEAIYHLVYMIYLDEVVEDVELEVATIYASALGFKPSVVSDLFKSIATEPFDETRIRNVRQEVIDFLKVNEA